MVSFLNNGLEVWGVPACSCVGREESVRGGTAGEAKANPLKLFGIL